MMSKLLFLEQKNVTRTLQEFNNQSILRLCTYFRFKQQKMDRDYYSRSRVYHHIQIKKQHRLLATVLKRLSHNKISQVFQRLKNNSSSFNRKMNRMHKILTVHNEICLLIGFQKLKICCQRKKLDTFVIKNAFMLGEKVKVKFLTEAWSKLNTNVLISKSDFMKRIQLARSSLMSRCLNKLYFKNKRMGWQKMNQHKIVAKIKKRVSSISTIFKNSQRRILTYSWIKLLKTNSKIKQKQIEAQIQDFQLQLQDMKVQIDNKNDNISRLQQQITELKQASTLRANDTSSFVLNTSLRNRSTSQLNKNKSKYSNYEIQSNEGSVGRDPSFGSLLGTSMLSWKSKASNKSNKAEQCQCQTCTYREKYQKYKATNSTLQKQLQIIKTQLQFTKDMNQHMQNEIKGYFNNEDLENKLEKLKNQLRQCQKQKEGFRDKVLKYEKYVNKLKMEFKVKIQEIYRRVKKNG